MLSVPRICFILAFLFARTANLLAQTPIVTEYPMQTPNPLLQNITAGPDGAVWFTNTSGKIGRITTAGVKRLLPRIHLWENAFLHAKLLRPGVECARWDVDFGKYVRLQHVLQQGWNHPRADARHNRWICFHGGCKP